MAAWRYEISLRSLVKYFSTREEKFRISKRPCNDLLITLTRDEISNHFTLKVFSCERRDLLCSRRKRDISCMKITCYFHM